MVIVKQFPQLELLFRCLGVLCVLVAVVWLPTESEHVPPTLDSFDAHQVLRLPMKSTQEPPLQLIKGTHRKPTSQRPAKPPDVYHELDGRQLMASAV